MKKRIYRLFDLLIPFCMVLATLCGCGEQGNTSTESSAVVAENSYDESASVVEALIEEETDYTFAETEESVESEVTTTSAVVEEQETELVDVENGENTIVEQSIEELDGTAESDNITEQTYDDESTETTTVEYSASIIEGKETETVTVQNTENIMGEQSVKKEDNAADSDSSAIVAYEKENGMTDTQRNSLNMLNFLTVLTQEINASKGSRLYIESVYSSLLNNTFPNAVDSRTQAQLMNILDTLEGYRMVDVKRERLAYIYEQNRAQAMKQAVPNPLSVLNVVHSVDLLKSIASVVYMGIDSYSSYSTYTEQTDLKYLQEGWELDDEESAELHNSRKQAFNYMVSMVRDNDIPGDYALNESAVQEFVTWKNNTNVTRRISFLESNQSTYKEFGTYWLTLAESYYENNDYRKCIDAIEKYEDISSRIFRKDYDYAKVLSLGIIASKQIYGNNKYIETAEKYAEIILDNCDNTDWTLTYYVAQVYLDLYARTNDKEYAKKAYEIVYDNVNYLIDEQRNLNEKYLADIVKAETPQNATKREKEEIKQYNKMLKVERKTALPPISEALYLNCDLLFSLADELKISSKEKDEIDSILHENGNPIFLMQFIDNRFRFDKDETLNINEDNLSFDGEELVIPASYMALNSSISVIVNNAGNETVFDDWALSDVTRKKGVSYTDFTASYESKTADKFKYSNGMNVVIKITPVPELPDDVIELTYNVVKKGKPFPKVRFERVNK